MYNVNYRWSNDDLIELRLKWIKAQTRIIFIGCLCVTFEYRNLVFRFTLREKHFTSCRANGIKRHRKPVRFSKYHDSQKLFTEMKLTTNNFLLDLSGVLCYICLTIWLTYRWNDCSVPASKLLSVVIIDLQRPWMIINRVIHVLKLVIFTGKDTVTLVAPHPFRGKTTLNSVSCFHRRK